MNSSEAGPAGALRRPKIMFVINSLGGGGAERVLATLLTHSLNRRGPEEISLALLDREAMAHPPPGSIELHQLDCRHSLLRSIAGVAGLVRKVKPDLTISFLTRANIATILAAGVHRGIRAVISERVNTNAHLATGRNAWASKALVRLLYPRAKKVIAVSSGVAETLISSFGVDKDRIEIVFNPVDVDRIRASASEAPAFEIRADDLVAMGRLVPNKNFELAIRSFAASSSSGRLIILGEGPDRAVLEALGAELGLGSRLVMPGFVANPYAVIARSRCMILSSNAEGFPNALVEALAVGVPAVATDCASGPAQVLQTSLTEAPFSEGSGGLLVPTGDVEAMTAALRAIADPALSARLIASGTNRVLDFSVDRATGRYWEIIETVLANQSRS